MRTFIFLLSFTSFSFNSSEIFSQNTKIHIQKDQVVSMDEVFDLIRNQTDITLLYQEDFFKDVPKVHLKKGAMRPNRLLETCFSGKNFKLEAKDNKSIIIATNPLITRQQIITVTGTVSDTNGQPLPGANILEKGTTNGVTTDFDGNFSINISNENVVLVASYIGFSAKEVTINGQSKVKITLEESTTGLGEVVIVGYGTSKKVNLTGAVASVKGDDLVRRPVTNPSTMLQGQMAGVQVVQGTGQPGIEDVSIRIRGTGTFSSTGSNPLVLIDGVQGNLSDLNPLDIENISVLKDAASASIYGARGANGVILVTTKSGAKGKPRLRYSSNFAIQTPTKLFDLITNSAEYMELSNEAKRNSGFSSTGLYTDEMIDDYRNATDRSMYPNTDWLDLSFRPAMVQNHNLSFSGGKEETIYNISMGYVNQEGVMKGFDYQKLNVRMNLSSEINENIKFGANFFLKNGKTSAPYSDQFVAILSQPPTYGPQLSDGSGRYTFKAYDFEENNKNPIAIIENDVIQHTIDYAIYTQGWLDIKFGKDVRWYTKVALNLDFSKYDDYRPQVPLYNFHTNEYTGLLDVGALGLEIKDEQSVYKNLYTYLTYDKTFGSGHTINALAGYSMEDNTSQYLSGFRKEFVSDALRELDAGSPSVQQANGSKTEWALMSFFGRLRYNFKDRYLLEVNYRHDGTSRLAKGNRWGGFPSFSAGWRISEEEFIKDLDLSWLSSFKFRGSFGQLGNQNIGLYPYQAKLSLTGNYSFDDANLLSGVAQTELANNTIKWETTTITDFGFDFSAFQGLNVTFDWYKKRTTSILRDSQVTDLVGLAPPTINNGTMENTGVELGLQYTKWVSSGMFKDLQYNIGFNFDHFENKLVDFGEREIQGYNIREEGREWDAFYMLEWDGIFQSEQEIASSPKQFNDATIPGDIKYKDHNGDNQIDNDDRVILSGKYPKFNYSLILSSNWKGFDLSAQFQGVEGVKYFVDRHGIVPFWQGSPPTNDWRDRWTETNPSTTMPRLYYGRSAPQRFSRNSSWFLKDGSYLRLKNLTFGYSIPQEVVSQIRLDQLRIYFSGDNLVTITDYPGLDPERAGSGRFLAYPQNKIYSIGLDIKF